MELAISNNELSTLIGDIYESSLTGKWEKVLSNIMDITHSNKAFFFLQQLKQEQPMIMEYKANFDSPANALISFQERVHEDPGYDYIRFMAEGDCLYINKHLDVGAHKGSAFYTEVYQPLKVFHAIAGVLCRDTDHDSLLVINRGENDSPYSEHEENFFKMITPHFSRAMHIFKELRLYKNYVNISKSILDQQDKAILVCDTSGTVVLHNDYAEQNLVLPSLIYLTNNKINISVSAYQKRFQYFIEQCTNLAYKDIGLQETLVIEQDEGGSVLITVSPLLNKNAFNDIDVPCCLVTVNYQHQINWDNIKHEFELTPKEMQLIKAIYSKQKLNDLTEVFNVTYNTLRTHLQSIFKKTQVNSQTELLVKLNMF